MFISPYSWRDSACLSFSRRVWILSFNFSSRSVAFSAEISSCFMFSPTASSSCSTSFSLLLALGGLLSRDLELLHVLTNGFKLLFNILQLALSQLCTLSCPLALILLDTQLPGQLIKLLLVVAGHLGGLPEIFVSLLKLNLTVHGLVLKVFDPLQNGISLLGCIGQFGNSVGQR